MAELKPKKIELKKETVRIVIAEENDSLERLKIDLKFLLSLGVWSKHQDKIMKLEQEITFKLRRIKFLESELK